MATNYLLIDTLQIQDVWAETWGPRVTKVFGAAECNLIAPAFDGVPCVPVQPSNASFDMLAGMACCHALAPAMSPPGCPQIPPVRRIDDVRPVISDQNRCDT